MKPVFSLTLLFFFFWHTAFPQKITGPIPLETFFDLFDKSISYQDSVFTVYGSTLASIDENSSSISWYRGFNATHTKHNEGIKFENSPVLKEFTYVFVGEKYCCNDGDRKITYDIFFQDAVNKFERFPDSVEKVGEYSAIVKSYGYSAFSIKVYKIASVNTSMIKILHL